MSTFAFELVSRDKSVPPRPVTMIDVPAENGRLTVLAHHEPFICLLKPGPLRVTDSAGNTEVWWIAAGTMTVSRDGVLVLVQDARRTDGDES